MLQLEIEKWVGGGFGLARGPEGVVLVKGALPGETVLAEVHRRKNHSEGVVRQILQPHPERYRQPLPPAANFPLEYPAQLPLKQQVVQEALERIGKVRFNLDPIAPSPLPLGYRTAAQYALHPMGGLAYRLPESHELQAIKQDPLIAEPLQKAFELLSSWPLPSLEEVVLRGSLYQNQVLVGFLGGEARFFKRAAQALVQEGLAGVIWAEPSEKGRFRGRVQGLAGEGSLLEDFGGVLSSVTVQSFAQVNPLAAGVLFKEAASIAQGGKVSLELYAGSGTLSLHLAPHFERLVAIEISRDAVSRGEADQERLGIAHLHFQRGDARDTRLWPKADLVAVDPPRAGLSKETVAALLENKPQKLLYISCDPATWARDVGTLVQGGYSLRFARPYDFYPFTHHVEVLSLLQR